MTSAVDLYSTSEVSRIFAIPASRLRSWDRRGFVRPSGKKGRLRYYTFQDLIGIRAAKGLLDSGLSFLRVRRSIQALRDSLPKVVRPLTELRVTSDGQRVVVTSEDGAFDPMTGQLIIDFRVKALQDQVVRTLRPQGPSEKKGPRTAYEWYLEGCRLDEDERTWKQAEAAYLQAVEIDPRLANAHTNLGNLRYRRGRTEEARALYTKALQVDPHQPEAHYNLGFLAFEAGNASEAVPLFRKALEYDASFSDAHFNLAMALEETGETSPARAHWEAYLALEPDGPWADIARRRLRRRG
jgi:DNA-binding transcriptional MerR regulator